MVESSWAAYYKVGIELASFEAISESATSTKAYKIFMYLQH